MRGRVTARVDGLQPHLIVLSFCVCVGNYFVSGYNFILTWRPARLWEGRGRSRRRRPRWWGASSGPFARTPCSLRVPSRDPWRWGVLACLLTPPATKFTNREYGECSYKSEVRYIRDQVIRTLKLHSLVNQLNYLMFKNKSPSNYTQSCSVKHERRSAWRDEGFLGGVKMTHTHRRCGGMSCAEGLVWVSFRHTSVWSMAFPRSEGRSSSWNFPWFSCTIHRESSRLSSVPDRNSQWACDALIMRSWP